MFHRIGKKLSCAIDDNPILTEHPPGPIHKGEVFHFKKIKVDVYYNTPTFLYLAISDSLFPLDSSRWLR